MQASCHEIKESGYFHSLLGKIKFTLLVFIIAGRQLMSLEMLLDVCVESDSNP